MQQFMLAVQEQPSLVPEGVVSASAFSHHTLLQRHQLARLQSIYFVSLLIKESGSKPIWSQGGTPSWRRGKVVRRSQMTEWTMLMQARKGHRSQATGRCRSSAAAGRARPRQEARRSHCRLRPSHLACCPCALPPAQGPARLLSQACLHSRRFQRCNS